MLIPYYIIFSVVAIPQALVYQNLINYLKKDSIPVYTIFIFAFLLMIITIATPYLCFYFLNEKYSSAPNGNQCGNGMMGLVFFWLMIQIYAIAVIFWWLILYIWQWWREKKSLKNNIS